MWMEAGEEVLRSKGFANRAALPNPVAACVFLCNVSQSRIDPEGSYSLLSEIQWERPSPSQAESKPKQDPLEVNI